MVTATRMDPRRGQDVPHNPDLSTPEMPASPTVKLPRDTFEALWWVARIEGTEPGKLLRELCGAGLSARLARYLPEIAKLRKLDEETARLERQAKAKAAE